MVTALLSAGPCLPYCLLIGIYLGRIEKVVIIIFEDTGKEGQAGHLEFEDSVVCVVSTRSAKNSL